MPKVQRRRSQAWKYFKVLNGKALCQVGSCDSELAWHGSTTALNSHLQSRHPDINLNSEESVLSSSICDESNNSLVICTLNQPNHREVLLTHQRRLAIDRALCKWLEEGSQPACIVEDPGFKNLLNVLEPNYRIPSAQALISTMNEKYEMAKNMLKKTIDSQCKTRKFSLNVNVLKGSKAWLCLSVHFLSDTWEMKSYVISTVVLAQLGESADIVEWLKVKTQEAHIRPSSVVAIVHDAEHKIAVAANRLCEIFLCPSVLSATSNLCSVLADVWKHVLTPSLERSITKIKETISIFDDHRLGSILLKILPRKENSLIADIESIAREGVFVNPDEPFLKMEYEECEDQQTTNGTWSILQTVINALQPFEAAIKYLRNDNKFVSASSSPVLFTGLKRKIAAELASDVEKHNQSQLDDFKNNFKARLLETLEEFTSFEPGDITVIAAAFDPRYKDLKFLSPHQGKSVLVNIINECYHVHSEDFEQDRSTATGSSIRNDSLKNSNSLVNTLLELGSGCSENREKIPLNDKQSMLRAKIGVEVDNYCEEERPQNDLCPLRWWSANQHKYPFLAVLARSYLSVPASTGNCGQNTLVANTLSKVCNHFHAGDIERVAFLQFNTSLYTCTDLKK